MATTFNNMTEIDKRQKQSIPFVLIQCNDFHSICIDKMQWLHLISWFHYALKATSCFSFHNIIIGHYQQL